MSASTHSPAAAYEDALLFQRGGKWEEKWCALANDGSLRVYAKGSPNHHESTIPLCAYDSLQTSGSWGFSAGPFELILSCRDRDRDVRACEDGPDTPERDRGHRSITRSISAILPRVATSGSLHSLYDRVATPTSDGPHDASLLSPDRAAAAAAAAHNGSSTSLNLAEGASANAQAAKANAWSRLTRRTRKLHKAGSTGGSGGGGSETSLNDRFRADGGEAPQSPEAPPPAATSPLQRVVSPSPRATPAVLVLRATSGAAMVRWAEVFSPYLQKRETAASGSPDLATTRRGSFRRAKPKLALSMVPPAAGAAGSAVSEEHDGCAIEEEDGDEVEAGVYGSPAPSSAVSITDLMEEAGKNARRRRNDLCPEGPRVGGGSGSGSAPVKESTAATTNNNFVVAKKRLSRISVETTRKLSRRDSTASSSEAGAGVGSARPGSASGLSLRPFGHRQRPSEHDSQPRGQGHGHGHGPATRSSVHSDRRASSPMTFFGLFNHTVPSKARVSLEGVSLQGTETDVGDDSLCSLVCPSPPPQRGASPSHLQIEPAQGSLDELLANERKHAMTCFTELRHRGAHSPGPSPVHSPSTPGNENAESKQLGWGSPAPAGAARGAEALPLGLGLQLSSSANAAANTHATPVPVPSWANVLPGRLSPDLAASPAESAMQHPQSQPPTRPWSPLSPASFRTATTTASPSLNVFLAPQPEHEEARSYRGSYAGAYGYAYPSGGSHAAASEYSASSANTSPQTPLTPLTPATFVSSDKDKASVPAPKTGPRPALGQSHEQNQSTSRAPQPDRLPRSPPTAPMTTANLPVSASLPVLAPRSAGAGAPADGHSHAAVLHEHTSPDRSIAPTVAPPGTAATATALDKASFKKRAGRLAARVAGQYARGRNDGGWTHVAVPEGVSPTGRGAGGANARSAAAAAAATASPTTAGAPVRSARGGLSYAASSIQLSTLLEGNGRRSPAAREEAQAQRAMPPPSFVPSKPGAHHPQSQAHQHHPAFMPPERIVPPDVMISTLDEISRLDPPAAALARQQLIQSGSVGGGSGLALGASRGPLGRGAHTPGAQAEAARAAVARRRNARLSRIAAAGAGAPYTRAAVEHYRSDGEAEPETDVESLAAKVGGISLRAPTVTVRTRPRTSQGLASVEEGVVSPAGSSGETALQVPATAQGEKSTTAPAPIPTRPGLGRSRLHTMPLILTVGGGGSGVHAEQQQSHRDRDIALSPSASASFNLGAGGSLPPPPPRLPRKRPAVAASPSSSTLALTAAGGANSLGLAGMHSRLGMAGSASMQSLSGAESRPISPLAPLRERTPASEEELAFPAPPHRPVSALTLASASAPKRRSREAAAAHGIRPKLTRNPSIASSRSSCSFQGSRDRDRDEAGDKENRCFSGATFGAGAGARERDSVRAPLGEKRGESNRHMAREEVVTPSEESKGLDLCVGVGGDVEGIFGRVTRRSPVLRRRAHPAELDLAAANAPVHAGSNTGASPNDPNSATTSVYGGISFTPLPSPFPSPTMPRSLAGHSQGGGPRSSRTSSRSGRSRPVSIASSGSHAHAFHAQPALPHRRSHSQVFARHSASVQSCASADAEGEAADETFSSHGMRASLLREYFPRSDEAHSQSRSHSSTTSASASASGLSGSGSGGRSVSSSAYGHANAHGAPEGHDEPLEELLPYPAPIEAQELEQDEDEEEDEGNESFSSSWSLQTSASSFVDAASPPEEAEGGAEAQGAGEDRTPLAAAAAAFGDFTPPDPSLVLRPGDAIGAPVHAEGAAPSEEGEGLQAQTLIPLSDMSREEVRPCSSSSSSGSGSECGSDSELGEDEDDEEGYASSSEEEEEEEEVAQIQQVTLRTRIPARAGFKGAGVGSMPVRVSPRLEGRHVFLSASPSPAGASPSSSRAAARAE